MIHLDVNVVVHAFMPGAAAHRPCADWIRELVNGDESFGIPDVVRSGFVRIATDRRIYRPAPSVESALDFLRAAMASPVYVPVFPGRGHFDVFSRLCVETRASGNAIPDAWLAALAMEAHAELATLDAGFRRFQGLRLRSPMAAGPCPGPAP